MGKKDLAKIPTWRILPAAQPATAETADTQPEPVGEAEDPRLQRTRLEPVGRRPSERAARSRSEGQRPGRSFFEPPNSEISD